MRGEKKKCTPTITQYWYSTRQFVNNNKTTKDDIEDTATAADTDSIATDDNSTAAMTTADNVAERARAHTIINSNRTQRVNDRSYKAEWKNYRAWVAEHRANNVLPVGPKYLTQENIDLYFSEKVVNRLINPDSARQVVSSLQRFADDIEYVDGQESFIVDSFSVKKALEAHKRLYKERKLLHVEDPHANLPTDVLSEDDCVRALQLAATGQNWKDMMLCWATCEQTYLRNDSMRKLHLRHLKCNHTHAPSCLKDNNYGAGYGFADGYMMSYILDQFVHKTRDTKKRVVGAWRHKDFILCSIGNLATNLFVRLYADGEINFYAAPLGKATPMWWNYKLIVEWKSEKAAYEAFSALLDAAGLSWAKVSHLRKQGMEAGSFRGQLESNQLGTMSKHKTEKIAAYETELFPPVMRVMAGFQQQSCYSVPRTRVFPRDELMQHPFPNAIVPKNALEAATLLIFPRIQEWRAQMCSPHGDKSKAAENFLNVTLEFLAVTMIQDGIYWLIDFPNHEATWLLLYAMPTWYPRWAAQARVDCREMAARHMVQSVQAGGDASGAVALAVQQSLTDFSTLVGTKIGALEALVMQQTAQMSEQTAQMSEQTVRISELETALVQQRTHAPADEPAANLVPQHYHLQPPLPPQPPPLEVTVNIRNVKETLQNIPRVPAFPADLPQTMAKLLVEHEKLDLASFRCSSRFGWSSSMKVGFGRRQFLYNKVMEKAIQQTGGRGPTNSNALQIAAAALDIERNGMTVYQFLGHLKKNDPTTKSQQKRQRETTA